jgi:hypothetical protein
MKNDVRIKNISSKLFLIATIVMFFLSVFLIINMYNQRKNIVTQTIEGKIYDAETNRPLPYAKVLLENGNTSVTADQNGKFLLVSDCNLKTTCKNLTLLFIKDGYSVSSKKINLEKSNLEKTIGDFEVRLYRDSYGEEEGEIIHINEGFDRNRGLSVSTSWNGRY